MTNMPFTVYRFDLIALGERPRNEAPVSHHPTAFEAMDEANRLRRMDRHHSYGVGAN